MLAILAGQGALGICLFLVSVLQQAPHPDFIQMHAPYAHLEGILPTKPFPQPHLGSVLVITVLLKATLTLLRGVSLVVVLCLGFLLGRVVGHEVHVC